MSEQLALDCSAELHILTGVWLPAGTRHSSWQRRRTPSQGKCSIECRAAVDCRLLQPCCTTGKLEQAEVAQRSALLECQQGPCCASAQLLLAVL